MAFKIGRPTENVSPHSKRARRIPDYEWDVWREELERLFLEDGISRKGIVDITAKKHNFDIT